MTTLQIHLLMLGLGLVAYLFLAGLFSNRKSYSKRIRRQWWIGVVAGIVVAASPLSRYWREPLNGMDLLSQSLLVAAISLLALLLFALLRYPLHAIMNNKRKTDATDAQLDGATQLDAKIDGVEQVANAKLANTSTPIVINADHNADHAQTDVQAAFSKDPSPAEVTLDRSMQHPVRQATPPATLQNDAPLTLQDDVQPADAFVSDQHSDHDDLSGTNNNNNDLPVFTMEGDQANTQKLEMSDIESVVNMKSKHDGTYPLDEKYRQSSAANDNDSKVMPSAGNELDLSETEELFAEIRQQSKTVDLPNEDELRQAKANATIDELDLDTQLIQNEEKRTPATNKINAPQEVIEEAEVLELDDKSLEFGNDLTGAYAHPAADTPSMNNASASSVTTQSAPLPETLDDAIIAAKVTAAALQTQVSNLENSITELDDLRDATLDATIDASNIYVEEHDKQLVQKNALLRSEDEARQAAESVIAAQSVLIDRAKRQQTIVNSMLADERKRLSSMQVEVERSRKMARTAAQLARRAAVAQQETKDLAKREQLARMKSQESTRKAVTIARNAISALAAEERKHGVNRR